MASKSKDETPSRKSKVNCYYFPQLTNSCYQYDYSYLGTVPYDARYPNVDQSR